MKKLFLVFLATASLWPQVTIAQARASSPAESCSELHRQFDFIHRQIAMKDAEGVADDSAPRATMRELEMLNMRQEQLILLEFMRMRSCSAPSRVGGAVLYMLPAMNCRLARMRSDADTEEKCDMSKWEARTSEPSTAAQ